MKKKLFTYFLSGLAFIAPLVITVYIIAKAIIWTDDLLDLGVPGLGIVNVVVIITLIGYLGKTLVVKPFFDLLENFLKKVPLANIIYTAIRDLLASFVGDKKRFNQAVLVTMSKQLDYQRLGFITADDLSKLNLTGKVAVYLPHAYNFSGNLIIVPAEHVYPIDAASSEVMKFIVSGGVSGFDHDIDLRLNDENQV